MWSDFNHHHCSNCQSLKILLYCTARSLSHIDAKLYVYIHLLHTAPTISIVFWRRVEKHTDKDHNDTQFCVSLWLDCIIITVYLFSIFAIISMSARPLSSLCYGFFWNEKKSYFCYKRIAENISIHTLNKILLKHSKVLFLQPHKHFDNSEKYLTSLLTVIKIFFNWDIFVEYYL